MPKEEEAKGKERKSQMGIFFSNISQKCPNGTIKKFINYATENSHQDCVKYVWKEIKPKKDIHFIDRKNLKDWTIDFCKLLKNITRLLSGNLIYKTLKTKYNDTFKQTNEDTKKYVRNLEKVDKKVLKEVFEKCEKELNTSFENTFVVNSNKKLKKIVNDKKERQNIVDNTRKTVGNVIYSMLSNKKDKLGI